MTIHIYQDTSALLTAAATLICQQAAAALTARGRFNLVLSGGSTPRQLYEELAKPAWAQQLAWKNIYIFWGDERLVPPDDPRSNFRMAKQALLDHINIPPENIYPIPHCQTAAAASLYESALQRQFGQLPTFDFILLGLGEDGHTASLFPNTAAVTEQNRWVCAVPPPLGQGPARITLTLPVINRAEAVCFLVTGRSKAAIVHRLLIPAGNAPALPAQQVAPVSGTLTWLLDAAAAAELPAIAANTKEAYER